MSNVINFGKAPAPDAGLTPAQSETWKRIVDSVPSDFFKACDLPLLRELVLALDMASELAEILKQSHTVEDMKRVLDLRDREVRRAAALSRTLRISPQSRYDRHAAGKALRGDRSRLHEFGSGTPGRPWAKGDEPEGAA